MQNSTIQDQLHILLNNPLAYVQGVFQGKTYQVTAQDEVGLLTIADQGLPAFDQVDPALLESLVFGFPALSDHVEAVTAYDVNSDQWRWWALCRFMNWTDETVSTLLERPVTLTMLTPTDYHALLCSLIGL